MSMVTADYGQTDAAVWEESASTGYRPEAGLPLLRFVASAMERLWSAAGAGRCAAVLHHLRGMQVALLALFCAPSRQAFRIPLCERC